ncbi:MAG: hypothetical protein JKY27_08735 [Magnetovibrio sp.]|nr:hypothetical protein [Magnetovibrio sp.]
MKDIVKRLKGINDESLIMTVVRDCMDAAEEIELLRSENDALSSTMGRIKHTIIKEEQNSKKRKSKASTK